ncbi:MAG: SMC family ATPase [Caldilineaceae bacterium]
MRIIALDLENTKSYAKGHIEFTDGVNAIVGHNGAGKSTILEAIGFTLFDCLTGYKQSDFIREGAKSAEITVTIVSNLDDRSYQVLRRCGSSNLHAIFDPDLGAKICEGKADVLHFLRQHMGVDPTADLARLFSDAVGVPQGTFTAAFLQTPAQRKAVFDPLLQVEEYKQAFDKLLDPLRTLQKQQQDLQVESAAYQGRLERLPTLETAIAARAQTLAQLSTQVESSTAELQEINAERSAFDAIQQEVVARRAEQQQTEQQQHTACLQLQSAQQALQEAEVAHAIVSEHQADYQQFLEAQSTQQKLEQQVQARQQLERKQVALDKTLSITDAELARVEQELSGVTAAEARVAELTAAVTEQERLEAALQSAQQQSLRLADAQSQLTKLEQNRQHLAQRLQQLQGQLAQVADLEAQRTAQEQSGETLRRQIDENKDRLARFKAEADALKEQTTALAQVETALCPLCEQPLTPEHRHALQMRNEERLESLRLDYRTAQQAGKEAEGELNAAQATLKTLLQQLRAMPREEEQKRLQDEWQAAGRAVATQQELVGQFSNAPALVQQLSSQLQALGDPRQQRAIALATADRRPALEQQKAQAVAKQTATSAEMAALKVELTPFATLDHELSRVAQTIQATTQAYQTVLRHQQVAATLETRQTDVKRLHALVENATAAMASAAAALAAIEAKFDAERYQTLRAEEQRLRDDVNTLRTELTLLQREQAREEQERATLLAQQQQLTALLQKQEEVRQQIETLEALRNLLRQAGPYITKALIRQISDGATQVFSDIMQDYTRHLSWNEDYGITLEVDGRERQFAQLSGGEQMSGALAVRLALLREMSSIDVAFFDEPTTNLDETRRDALARQILEVKGFRQLFVISHDDTFEQATQNLIRIARVNGVSTVLQS